MGAAYAIPTSVEVTNTNPSMIERSAFTEYLHHEYYECHVLVCRMLH